MEECTNLYETHPPYPTLIYWYQKEGQEMLDLKYKGYKEATVRRISISIGELRHRMCRRYLKKKDQRFILICLNDGNRLETKSMEDALDFEWCDDCMIELINLPHKWGYLDEQGNIEEDTPTIILFQMSEEETDGSPLIG